MFRESDYKPETKIIECIGYSIKNLDLLMTSCGAKQTYTHPFFGLP